MSKIQVFVCFGLWLLPDFRLICISYRSPCQYWKQLCTDTPQPTEDGSFATKYSNLDYINCTRYWMLQIKKKHNMPNIDDICQLFHDW